jgi:hypothetical protein
VDLRRALRRTVEATLGIVAVAAIVALVGALVVAFGIRAAEDEDPALDVGPSAGAGPVVSTLEIERTVGDLEITLLRVERLSFGGRIYLRAVNRGASAVAIPDSEVVLLQGRGPARPAPNSGGRLPRFGPSISSGETSFSVLFFPRLRRGGAVVRVQWFSPSTTVVPEPVEFSFQVR